MKYLVSWLAMRRDTPDYVDVGFLARSSRNELRAYPLAGFEPAVAALQEAVTGAAPERVPDLWDYLLERGMGAQSSFSEPTSVVADDFDALAAKLLPEHTNSQHLAGEGASG